MTHDVLFVLGLPGSGKGTQARKLSEKLGFFYFETGEILRHIAQDNTPFGVAAKRAMNEGALLQDEDIEAVLKLHLRGLEPGKGIIFDGVPRRLGQGAFLLEYLKNELGHRDMGTILINISTEECAHRIAGRAVKEGRADDNPQAVAERVKQQSATLGEVLGFLSENSKVYDIDGMPPIEDVEKAIYSALGI